MSFFIFFAFLTTLALFYGGWLGALIIGIIGGLRPSKDGLWIFILFSVLAISVFGISDQLLFGRFFEILSEAARLPLFLTILLYFFILILLFGIAYMFGQSLRSIVLKLLDGNTN